jgi:AcrR family transcriptional regulator
VDRPNQKFRTRKDLLQAAARLMEQGRRPSLEEIAEAALVSRATAYRYFPGLDALLLEASLDVALPTPEALFAGDGSNDPAARVERAALALHEMIAANEPALRMMLVHALQRGLQDGTDTGLPARQNRRTPLIEAALAPARREFEPAAYQTLTRALAVLLGPEAMVVFKDVLRIDDAEALKVKRWAVRALVRAARMSRSGA